MKPDSIEAKYEILKSLPAYGPMYTPISESGERFYSEGFVVKFFKKDGTNWVGNFKEGWTGLNAVYDFNDYNNLLVIAGGTCYIMNPEETKPIMTFGVGYETVIKAPKNRLILQDSTELSIVEANGEIWHTERISWDGIKELRVDGQFVKGLSFNPTSEKGEWVDFVVDLERRKVKGGSYRQFEVVVEIGKQFKKNWFGKLLNKIKGRT